MVCPFRVQSVIDYQQVLGLVEVRNIAIRSGRFFCPALSQVQLVKVRYSYKYRKLCSCKFHLFLAVRQVHCTFIHDPYSKVGWILVPAIYMLWSNPGSDAASKKATIDGNHDFSSSEGHGESIYSGIQAAEGDVDRSKRIGYSARTLSTNRQSSSEKSPY